MRGPRLLLRVRRGRGREPHQLSATKNITRPIQSESQPGTEQKKKAWQQLFAHSSSVSASSSVIVRPNAESETEAQTPGVYEQLRGVRLGQLRIVIERYCLGKFMYDNMKSFFLIGLLHNRYFKCTVWT